MEGLFSTSSLQFPQVTSWLTTLGLYNEQSAVQTDVPKVMCFFRVCLALFILHQMSQLMDENRLLFNSVVITGRRSLQFCHHIIRTFFNTAAFIKDIFFLWITFFLTLARKPVEHLLRAFSVNGLLVSCDGITDNPADKENSNEKMENECKDLLDEFEILTEEEIEEAVEKTKNHDESESLSQNKPIQRDTKVTSEEGDIGEDQEETINDETTCESITTTQNDEQCLENTDDHRSVQNDEKSEEKEDCGKILVKTAEVSQSHSDTSTAARIKNYFHKLGENLIDTPSRPVTFNTIQSILTFRSAIQGVIDDMVTEELELLVVECVSTELQFTDVVEKYEHLMPLDEYCTKMDELYDEKHDHIAELGNLARTSNILWNRAIDYKQQSEEQEDMVRPLRRENKAILKDLNVLRKQHNELKQDVGDIPRKFWQRVEQGFKPNQ